MTPELVLLERRGAVALLTLNRPDKLNALNYALVDRINERLDAIEAASDIRAVILTGAGDRAFSAGADITEFSETIKQGPDAAVRAFPRRGQSMTAKIEAFPKPVIVAVNGIAFGGGCEITEAAHLAVASERASFGKPEINIGISADLRRYAASPAPRGPQARAGIAADRGFFLGPARLRDRARQPHRGARGSVASSAGAGRSDPAAFAAHDIAHPHRGDTRAEHDDSGRIGNRERAVRARGCDLRHKRGARCVGRAPRAQL